MTDYKIAFGVLATAIGFVGFLPYLRDMFRGKTKPHAFSWLAWGTLETIAFFAQVVEGGGTGTWVTGISAAICLFIAAFALVKKDKEISLFDWVALSGALIGIILWRLTDDPLLAVICVTAADAFGFLPTFRKEFRRPGGETLIEYGASVAKWIVGIFALQSYSLAAWLYPASLILSNGAFVVMALARRRILASRGRV